MATALLWPAPLAAAGPHRAAAEQAERVGDWPTAEREYSAAFAEDREPDLLYRAGVARRRLRLYAQAREAFRQYLRMDPAGALKDEAERQLVQLDVIVEELRRQGHESPGGAPPKRRPERRPVRQQRPPAAPAESRASFEPLITTVANPAATAGSSAAVGPGASAAATPAEGPPRSFASDPPRSIAAAAEPRPSIAAEPSPRAFKAVEPSLSPAFTAPSADAPFPARSLAPWVATGAAALAVSGGLFWWDGSRVSRDLDARFASGDLAAADAARYGRARNESIAGRILVGAALCAAAAAVWLWR